MASNVIDRLSGVRSSQAMKVPCRVATTGPITLSGEQTIDTVELAEGDSVLVKNQSNGAENGVWVVSKNQWKRRADWDGYGDILQGTSLFVASGVAGAGHWFITTSNPLIVGETAISFAQIVAPVENMLMPTGGVAGQALTKASGDDRDVDWRNPVPLGGATGQVLSKSSNDDGDVAWATPPGGGDMITSVYDSGGVAANVFAMDNMTEGEDTKIMTAAERVLLAGLSGMIGVVASTARSTAPNGWLLCYGQEVSRATYAALFDAIGTEFGDGDGSTTFNLPDVRDRVSAGKGNMGGASANRLTGQSGGINGNVLGAVGGAETHQLTTAQLAAHRHFSIANASSGSTLTNSNQPAQSNAPGEDPLRSDYSIIGTDTAATIGRTSETGSGNAHNNVQPTIIFNMIIFTGVLS